MDAHLEVGVVPSACRAAHIVLETTVAHEEFGAILFIGEHDESSGWTIHFSRWSSFMCTRQEVDVVHSSIRALVSVGHANAALVKSLLIGVVPQVGDLSFRAPL